MLGVSRNSCTERILGALHKIAASTSVYVKLHTAWHYAAAFGVDNLSTRNLYWSCRNLCYLAIFYYYCGVFYPTLWSKHTSAYNFHLL